MIHILLSRIQRLACLGITGAMRTTPTRAMEALICLPPLEMIVQGEARMAAHRLWSLGCWSYLHPNKGHSSILKRLQQSDPILNIGVVMRPAFNLEPKYRVTMLTREDWTLGSGPPLEIKGLVWYTDGSRMKEGTWAGVMGQSLKRRLSFSLGRYTMVSRLRYLPSWPVFMIYNLKIDQRNMSVYALIVRRY